MKQRKPAIQTSSGATRRCAIYTRKSSEEGLEQAFNSLHAQREACSAYILSQLHEGWVALPTLYDDGGISGGTMDRPALQQLLADIRTGKVDLVVVYKVDRLTRSLADFAKIVDVFDASGASFVSVTQQFNTTTSMGRLTLNMLLSFAQFEREVTGERIRDKIAASKRKGMWMGGNVPLGYEVQARKLVINQQEADTVRHVFRTYLKVGSVQQLGAQLVAEGITGRLRVGAARQRCGGSLGRGALYYMLQNRAYRGEVHHQGAHYAGEHPPIVDAALWEAVQTQLTQHRQARRLGTQAAHPSLLVGIVYDRQGERLVPTHANKDGRRYRYYVSQSLNGGDGKDGLRVAAADLEEIVTRRLLEFLGSRSEVFAAIKVHCTEAHEQHGLLTRAPLLAVEWASQSAAERRALLGRIVARIEVQPDQVTLNLGPTGFISVLGGAAEAVTNLTDQAPICLIVPVQLTRWRKEVRLLIRGQSDETKPNPALVRLIAKAHAVWGAMLRDDLTATALAEREGLDRSYIGRLARLAFLAPDITCAILSGQQPAAMTACTLMKDATLPLAWHEQRQRLGF